jgi:putative Holliday junction resolvase
MRILAIDFGAKRIGLALGDDEARIASPLEVLDVSNPQDAIEQVIAVIASEQVDSIVVGLPLNMDGSIGGSARRVIEWAREIEALSGLKPIFVDERLSTFDAEQKLVDRKRAGEHLTRGMKKRRLDALAATALLQDYLDGVTKPIQCPT